MPHIDKPALSLQDKILYLLSHKRVKTAPRSERKTPWALAYLQKQVDLPDHKRDTPNERRLLSIEELHGSLTYFLQHGYFADENPHGQWVQHPKTVQGRLVDSGHVRDGSELG